MKEDMAKEETRLIAQEDTLMKLQREFDPIAQKIQEIDSRWDEFHEIDTKIEKLKTEQKGLQKNLQETKAQLQTELPGSIEDLESERRQFDRSVREKQIEMDNVSDSL